MTDPFADAADYFSARVFFRSALVLAIKTS